MTAPLALRVVVSPCRAMSFICRHTAAGKPVQPRLTVSRLKGRPFYGQAMGQLRLTCTFSAECAQRDRNAPLSPPMAVLPPKGETTHYILCVASLLQNVFAVHPRGSVSRDFQVAIAPLQITFACHPGGESLLSVLLLFS